MEEIIRWEAYSSSVITEITHIAWKPQVSPLPFSQDSVICLHPDPKKNLIYLNQSYFFKIYL